jgi:hypothetical protein
MRCLRTVAAHECRLRFLLEAKTLACRPVRRHSAERALLHTSTSTQVLFRCGPRRPFVAQTACVFDPHDEAKFQGPRQTPQGLDCRVSASVFDCRNYRLRHVCFRRQIGLYKPACHPRLPDYSSNAHRSSVRNEIGPTAKFGKSPVSHTRRALSPSRAQR